MSLLRLDYLESLTLREAMSWAALMRGPPMKNWNLLPASTWVSSEKNLPVPVKSSETIVLGVV